MIMNELIWVTLSLAPRWGLGVGIASIDMGLWLCCLATQLCDETSQQKMVYLTYIHKTMHNPIRILTASIIK